MIRFASLYVFDVVVLLAIGALLPQVRVGWAALWAAAVLTAATLWIKPAIRRLLDSVASRTGRGTEKAIEYGITFVVALAVWIIVAMFSGVAVRGMFWGYVLPPLALLAAWAIYDTIDDRLEKTAADVYDRTATRLGGTQQGTATTTAPPQTAQQRSATDAGRRELNDGLTDEQRRLLDDLG